MTNLKKIFGENVKHFRTIKGIAQGELAERTGINQARMSRLENGQIDIGLMTIEKVAQGLGVSSAELLISSERKENTINEKLLQIASLSEYDQKLIEGLLETFIEKNRLEGMQDVKMKKRLEELEKLRK